MQAQKVIGRDGEGGVGPASVIAEFHFENFRTENLHNGAHLSADQSGFGHVANQCDHGKEFEISHLASLSIIHNSLSTSEGRHPSGRSKSRARTALVRFSGMGSAG